MTQSQGWGPDFAKLRSHLDQARDALNRIAASVHAQNETANVTPGIATLAEEISSAKSLANQLSERLHGGPLGLLLHGGVLSREEYYLLVALGVLSGGSYTGDPYADFQMLHYEDDERRSYITLDERPSVGTIIKVHVGMWPEEISWDRLRPEQQNYFERYLPEVAARFVRNR
jgi:hypothetical protein